MCLEGNYYMKISYEYHIYYHILTFLRRFVELCTYYYYYYYYLKCFQKCSNAEKSVFQLVVCNFNASEEEVRQRD